MSRKIYLASSWRNVLYPGVLAALRAEGHTVYDFKEDGFGWDELDADWLSWTPEKYLDRLNSSRSVEHFILDRNALDWADTCVLLLPCGRSAHLEAGYAIGRGKETFVLLHPDRFEPELMYLLTPHDHIHTDVDALKEALLV